jgi:hypothetical protein
MQEASTPLAAINMADYGIDISDLIQFNGQPVEKQGQLQPPPPPSLLDHLFVLSLLVYSGQLHKIFFACMDRYKLHQGPCIFFEVLKISVGSTYNLLAGHTVSTLRSSYGNVTSRIPVTFLINSGVLEGKANRPIGEQYRICGGQPPDSSNPLTYRNIRAEICNNYVKWENWKNQLRSYLQK